MRALDCLACVTIAMITSCRLTILQVKDSIDLPDAMRSYFKQVTLRQTATQRIPPLAR